MSVYRTLRAATLKLPSRINCFPGSNHLNSIWLTNQQVITQVNNSDLLQLPPIRCKSGKNSTPSKKSNPKGNNKKLSDFIDDLDSDDEEEEEEDKLATKAPDEDVEVIFNSPVAKFVQEFHINRKKRKESAKGKGKSATSHMPTITYFEARRIFEIDDYWQALDSELENLKTYFIEHLTVRSVTALDNLPIELEGDKFPLHEITSISKKDPKRLIIDCSSFPQAANDVNKAILNAGMNLNPQQEGIRIIVPIPKVTKEYREQLAKGAKVKVTEHKERLKNIHSKNAKILDVKEMERTVAVNQDSFTALREVMHGMVEHFGNEAEQLLLKKQKEVLGKK